MPTAFYPCLNDWKTLYQAAIRDNNKGLLPQRVSEAEEAVKARGRAGDGTVTLEFLFVGVGTLSVPAPSTIRRLPAFSTTFKPRA
jgi:hypothetical protein